MASVQESAVAAYGGYEYQIIVTVWVALDLMIARACCDAVAIEPASQEDIAAELRVPGEAAEAFLGIEFEAGPVEIQIKRRSQFWPVHDFRTLVETRAKQGAPGPAPRPRALARLQADPRLRYLLITDAEVHPRLKDFVVDAATHKSAATDESASWVPAGVAWRIAICEKRVLELVEHEIEDILERSARVPLQRVRGCRAALVERVRDRLLGRRPPPLSRGELEALIAEHDGFPPSARDEFVPPAGFDDLQRRLDEPPFALVLVGPPGIGKTSAAQKLIELLRHADRPFAIEENPSPHGIRAALSRPGRTLFYLEDPWGRYKLADDAATWNDELPRLIREARSNPDKRFLVTSRTALLRESIDLSPRGRDPRRVERALGAQVASIEEGDFDAPARREILRCWMRGAKRWQRDWVEDRLQNAVTRLTVPQALSAFAHAVKSASSVADLKFDQLLAESQVAAIGDVVKQQVMHLQEVAAGITLWVFLSGGEPLTNALMQEIPRWLSEDAQLAANLPRLIEHLSANGWLSSPHGVPMANPTVIEGLERLTEEDPVTSNRLLRALLATLVRRGQVQLATRLLHGLSGRNVPVSTDVRSALEAHLRDAVLLANGAQFELAIEMLARNSAATEPVSLLVRALAYCPRRRGFDHWSPPAWTEAERAAVRDSPDAERVARRYIRVILGERFTSSFGDEELADFLCSLGWSLGDEFVSAALLSFERGADVAGALRGALAAPQPAFDQLLQAALAEHDRVDRWYETEGIDEQVRRAEEGEIDAVRAAHVLEDPGERYYPSRTAFETIVAARRAQQGYAWLTEHPRRAILLRAWAKAIPYASGEAVKEELRALLGAAESWNRSGVWEAIGRSRCLSLAPLLLERLSCGPLDELAAVWGALAAFYDPDELATVGTSTLQSASWTRRAAIVFAVRNMRISDRCDHPDREPAEYACRVRDVLPLAERGALDACTDVLTNKVEPPSNLDADVLDAIAILANGPDELLGAGACVVLARSGRAPPAAVERLLLSTDKWVRLHALRAIGRRRPPDRALLSRMLSDPYYQCRRCAMFVLSADASAEERLQIIAMANDPSAPVREACASIIGSHQWSDGLGALCALLKDSRNRNEGGLGTDAAPEYHVAREASIALKRFSQPLPPPTLGLLLQFLQGGRKSSADLVVHYEVLAVVGKELDPALAPLIERLLRSTWRMGGEQGSFPLRYAAAWSWVDQVLDHPDSAALLSAAVLVEAAGHTDGRLAAPALLVLGIVWGRAPDGARQVLSGPDISEGRVLLLEIGARIGGGTIQEDLIARRLSKDHPARRLITWCWDVTEEADAWSKRLATDGEVQKWIQSVGESDPVNAALRAGLLQSPRQALLTTLSMEDFRADELTIGVKTISMFHFAGLE